MRKKYGEEKGFYLVYFMPYCPLLAKAVFIPASVLTFRPWKIVVAKMRG